MKLKLILALVTCSFLAATASAHGPKTGPNGGPQVDAGNYHVELVAKGAALTVYLRDENDKAVPSAGHKGTAILVVEGKPQRIELTPSGDNMLTGAAAAALPAAPKGAVQISTPSGKTAQAKFE